MKAQETDLSGLGKPLPIKVSRIEPLEGQPRRYFDPVTIAALADSIQDRGQDTPIVVCRHPDKPGVFKLIGGERRWRAKHIIWERTGSEPTLESLVRHVRDYADLFKQAFVNNLQREDLIPLDEAAALHRLHYTDKTSFAEIAKMIGKSVSYVDGRIRIHGLPDDVKKLMDPARPKDEQLSVSSAIEIVRSTSNPALQLELAHEVVDRGLGMLETRSLMRARGVRVSSDTDTRRGRKPSDNYYVWTSFLQRTLRELSVHTSNMSITTIYDSRSKEELDREKDTRFIDELIKSLQDARRNVIETSMERLKRTGSI